MLPEGFHWTERWQRGGDELALKLDGTTVAQLMQRINGEWYADLWTHHGIARPLVTRPCRTRETGIAGVEAWACRHEARLRAEVAAIPRPVHRGAG